MLVDITLKITPKMATDAQGNEKNLAIYPVHSYGF